jgi:3-keto-5-aminohexanoate cleavage enzyme
MKMIVTVAPTSNFHGKEANPALPFSPQEVAEAVYECWNEGASIVHIHGRDEKGLPTNDPSFFQEADRLIREKKMRYHYPTQYGPGQSGVARTKRG